MSVLVPPVSVGAPRTMSVFGVSERKWIHLTPVAGALFPSEATVPPPMMILEVSLVRVTPNTPLIKGS